ncbi:ATP-binding protein [Nocardia sp. NBC_01377]|uniref:ATP-binding protein n=1 Tax=Nocardia sp. NBC_01377 TaxID=2903595 RepID=UPI00386A02EE
MGMGDWASRSSTKTTTIAVCVPARLEQLIMVRALAETVCLIADFALDEVTDIRLALDEVATTLVLDAAPDTNLDCRFSYDDASMFVHVAAVATSEAAVGQDGFGWHIVRTLTDSIAAVQQPYDHAIGGYPTLVDFSWVRTG